jgi:hypothetical protein
MIGDTSDTFLVSLFKAMQVWTAVTALWVLSNHVPATLGDIFQKRENRDSRRWTMNIGISVLFLMILLGNGWASAVYAANDLNPLQFGPTPLPLRFVLLIGYQIAGAAFLASVKPEGQVMLSFVLYSVLGMLWYLTVVAWGFPHLAMPPPGI